MSSELMPQGCSLAEGWLVVQVGGNHLSGTKQQDLRTTFGREQFYTPIIYLFILFIYLVTSSPEVTRQALITQHGKNRDPEIATLT